MTFWEKVKATLSRLVVSNWREAFTWASTWVSIIMSTGAAWWIAPTTTDMERQSVLDFLGLQRPGTLVIIGLAIHFLSRIWSQGKP